MNKIEKLIAEYCPDGVEFKKLGEVALIGTGNRNTQDAISDSEYPFYVRSKDIKRSDNYSFDEEAIVIPGEGGVGEIFHYVSGKYALHQRAYRIHFTTDGISTKYAYYYLLENFKGFITRHAVNATVSSIRKPMIEKFTIPIPPLTIQKEIVKILDTFTKLEAELEAELKARQKQYEYYRDELLTFVKGMERKELGEICVVASGGTPSKSKKEFWEDGNIPWLKSESCKNEPISYSNNFITDLGLQNSSAKLLKEETTLMALVGATIFKTAYLEFESTTNQNIANIKSKDSKILNDKFIFYYLTNLYGELKNSLKSYGMLNLSTLRKFKIPTPLLAEQERIVKVLDKFDALVNDISIGLPAELNARRKQYEYYRGKLLTFKEKGYAKQ